MTLPPSTDSYRAVFERVEALRPEIDAYADSIRVVFLRNITVEGAETLLQHHLVAHRIRAEVVFGGYGSMVQDVVDADGPVARLDPDLVVLWLTLDELDTGYGLPGWEAEPVRQMLAGLFELLATRTRATVCVHTFVPPLHAELGLAVDAGERTTAAQVRRLNAFIVDEVRRRSPRFVLADWEGTVRRLGVDAAFDPRARLLWRAPLRRAFLDDQASLVARVAAALKGRAKKVLVLDCDNTLWGGVVGEDGIDGIALDVHQHPGRAFREFQAAALHLAERGVLLALCSKNEEQDVFEVLDRHPACLIKRSHLSAWRVNWRDKAANIAELADELNLGLDAFVFVDDNPVECGLVRELLPQVTVVQTPARAHELPQLLWQGGWFDTLSITDEDRQRARLYQGEAQRKAAMQSVAGLDDYLASLQTVATIRRDDPKDVPRAAQLTQKTNQFNLVTRRCSEADVQEIVQQPGRALYTLSVADRFGGLGLVGVLALSAEGGVGRVDNFLMSCRALGRRLEDAMVVHCLSEFAVEHRLTAWEAAYRPTSKNAQVAGFWDRFGFLVRQDSADGRRYHRPAQEPWPTAPEHIAIERR